MKRLALCALLTVAACKLPTRTVPCNTDSQCSTGEVCAADGTCQTAPACSEGERLCDHVCTPVNTVSNCGVCGNACAAGLSCVNGACAAPSGSAAITAPAYADQGAANLMATVTSSDPAATYAWTIMGGAFAGGAMTASGAMVQFSAGRGSSLSLAVVATSMDGAQVNAAATVQLVAPMPASVSIITARIVPANAINLPARVVGIAGAQYSWTLENGTMTMEHGTDILYTAGAQGMMTLAVVATSLSGSTAVGQAQIQIAPPLGALAITTVPSAAVGQGGLGAQVQVADGVGVQWSISGGTFAGPSATASGASVQFTAGLGPAVVLNATATNQAGETQSGSATIPVTIGTPLNLAAVGGRNQVSLRWDTVPGATLYHVLRAGSGDAAPTVAFDMVGTSAIDRGRPNGKHYVYQVEAATPFIDGAASASAAATTDLPAPAGLAAQGGASIALSWSPVANAASYALFRSVGDGAFAAIGSQAGTSASDSSSLQEGVKYTYKVHAVTADAESADSNLASVVVPLSPPSGLTATAAVFDISLAWSASPAASGYEIFRSTAPDSGFALIDTSSGASYCNCASGVSPPQPATTYYYQVRAITSAAESEPSNIASVTTVFPAPASLGAEILNRNSVVLSWEPVSGAPGYELQRSLSAQGPFTAIAETATTSWTDSGLLYSTGYVYRVVTTSPAGNSPPSPLANATTGATPYNKGAGLFGGEVQAVLFDPAAPSVAWAGVHGGAGLYRSTDAGATWSAASSGLTSNSIHALAFSQGTLFASARGDGLYAMAPGAAAFSKVGSGLGANDTYLALASDPEGSGTLYVASYASLFRSGDNGATWQKLGWKAPAPITSLAVSPGDSTTAYAATDGAGLFVTQDSGASWSPLGPAGGHCQGGVQINPDSPSELWLGTSAGLFTSADSGQTWSSSGSLSQVRSVVIAGSMRIASTSGGGIQMSTGDGQFWSIGSFGAATEGVTALASSGATLLAGSSNGAGLFRSADYGATWAAASAGIDAASASAVAISQLAPANLYAIAGYGVVKSNDHGATWQPAMGSGIRYPVVTSAVAIDPANASTVYVGAQGVLRSTDSGASWKSTHANFVATALAIASSSTGYAAVYDVGVYKSVNLNGATPSWSLSTATLSGQGMRTVAVAPSFAGQVYAGGDHGIWASADSGNSWSAPVSGQLQGVRSIAVDPSRPGTVYVVVAGGASGSQVRKSINGGVSFTDLGFGSSALQNLTSIAVDPANAHVVYALGTSANGSSGGLYRSSNGGAAWRDVSAGLGTRQLRGLVLDPNSSGTLFVASDDNGLLVTTSGGL